MTTGTISSGLVENPPSSTPYVPPTKNDWDILFQLMFDKYFNPPLNVVSCGLPVVSLPFYPSSFRNPTAHDMEVLIKSLLMPLSIKTINDSYCFVHELKTEMHEDFEYVESLEKEIDELESKDLKAQMQDKNIAISELKKLIENCKGKSVETQFDKPSVVRQPNAQRIPKPSFRKPTPFHNSPPFLKKNGEIRKQAVRNTNVIAPGPSRNNPKHVSFQSPKEFVGSNDMVHNYYLEKAKKSAQLQKDKMNWQASMSSRVSNKDVHLGEHRKQKPFLKFNDLQCPTCKKCLYSANHDECVLEYLSRLNPRIPTRHRFSNKKTTTVPEKTMNPRSCLKWQLTGRILKTVGLRWVPTGKLFNSCTSKVKSEPTHGSNIDIHHIHACKQTLGLSAGTSFNGQMQQRIDLNADALYNEKKENLRVCSSSLVLHQMTSDHNRSELRIQDHSNEQSSSKLVPKVVP
ncbi:hypothetical protein Tco_0707623 [Tanacetum coccineum]|uniref:Uncharacterized protein n=1 Tax=Tanacetum coccineum TaxID=301880 RepID=A0ABQ4YC99_9ASTR